MRIAYYIDTVIPTKRANMVHVMKMCQAFTALGHSVTLLCGGGEKHVDIEKIWEQYAISQHFEVKLTYIPKWIQKYGRRFGAYYGAWLRSKILVDCDFAYSRSAASLLFVRNRKRYVYEAHIEPDIVNREIERIILKHENCVGLVVISKKLRDRYLELFPFLSKDKITVLHDAADMDLSDSVDKAELMNAVAGYNVGYLGHLYPGKCMETLIPLAQRCQKYRFHVVGGTEEWIDYWKTQAREQKNIIFYGYVDNSKIGEYYRAFDIAILPFSKSISIGKKRRTDIGQWTSPLKLFEAMAYAKPIIVSRLPTIEEVMEDGKDCIMAEPGDIDDWEKKLTELCADARIQEQLGRAAQEKLKCKYTWTERARKAAELFR